MFTSIFVLRLAQFSNQPIHLRLLQSRLSTGFVEDHTTKMCHQKAEGKDAAQPNSKAQFVHERLGQHGGTT